RISDCEIVLNRLAEQIDGGDGIVLLQLHRGANCGNKIPLHNSVQWRFLAEFVCEPFGFVRPPRPGERESQNHSLVSIQFTLKCLILSFASLDYVARLSVLTG